MRKTFDVIITRKPRAFFDTLPETFPKTFSEAFTDYTFTNYTTKQSAFKANFDELLEKDGSISILHRNIQTLAIEILSFLNGLSALIMNGSVPG